MSFLGDRNDPVKPGDAIPSAAEFNRIFSQGARQLRGGAGASITEMGDRVVVRGTAPYRTPGVGTYTAQFLVRSVSDDSLLCVPLELPTDPVTGRFVPPRYDPAAGGSSQNPVQIAKPYALRKSTWDGRTVVLGGVSYLASVPDHNTLVLTSSVGVLRKRLSLPYVPGEIVHATLGTTGLSTAEADIVWTDCNSAGRSWEDVTRTGCLLSYVADVCEVRDIAGLLTGVRVLRSLYDTAICQDVSSYWEDAGNCDPPDPPLSGSLPPPGSIVPLPTCCPAGTRFCADIAENGYPHFHTAGLWDLAPYPPDDLTCQWNGGDGHYIDDGPNPAGHLYHWLGVQLTYSPFYPSSTRLFVRYESVIGPTTDFTSATYAPLFFTCAGGGVFTRINPPPGATSVFPEIIPVSPGPCAGTGSGPGSGPDSGPPDCPCDDTLELCLNIADGSTPGCTQLEGDYRLTVTGTPCLFGTNQGGVHEDQSAYVSPDASGGATLVVGRSGGGQPHATYLCSDFDCVEGGAFIFSTGTGGCGWPSTMTLTACAAGCPCDPASTFCRPTITMSCGTLPAATMTPDGVCVWTANLGDESLTVAGSGATLYLTAPGGGGAATYLCVTFNCIAANIFTLDSSTGTCDGEWPSSVTLDPGACP